MKTLFAGIWTYVDNEGRTIEVTISLDKSGCDRLAAVLAKRAMKSKKRKATIGRGAIAAHVRILLPK